MLTKNELKYFSNLLKKKNRTAEQKFIVEGEKILLEGLNSNFGCEIIICSSDFANKKPGFLKRLIEQKTRIEIIGNKLFEKLSDTKTTQGIAAVFNCKANKFVVPGLDSAIVYCDDISEPGNLGAVLRNCDWFGINTVLLSKNSADIYNPKVIRSSMGSIFHLNIFENIEPADLINLKSAGYKIYSTDLKGKNIYQINFPVKTVYTFSNEAHGISESLIKIVDEVITIPKLGSAESLNVACASAVILSQISRTRS